MRAVSADVDAILRGVPKFRARVQVKDSGGTFRDLSTYAGENLLKHLTWHEDIDSPGITWEAVFVREMELLSLAPLMQTSGLNRQFNIATAYAALIQVGRQMKVEYSLQAEDDPAAPTWLLAFTGYIDTVSWGESDDITISGRGDEAVLIDTYIERDRVYALATGANADRGCYIFQTSAVFSTTYAVGDRVVPTNLNINGHFYRVTSITTGIPATTEPAWPTGAGSTVVSGGVTFTESGSTTSTVGTAVETVEQQILNDTMGIGVVTLNTPVSPAWLVKWFQVSRQLLFDELRLLADQIGWCIRPKFDAGSGTMKLTLYDPVRSNTTSARTFSKSLATVKRAEIRIADIRNAIDLIFSDSQDLDSGGHPKRKKISVTDPASIAKYGRRWGEVQEADTSNIDTSAEATTLANAILSDLKEPSADFEVSVPLFPQIELTDLYTLAANGVHFDVDQKLAVVGFDHVYSADECTTTFRVRGTPASGKSMWLQRMTDSENGETHAVATLDNVAIPLVTLLAPPVGGTAGTLAWAGGKGNRPIKFEFHLSTSNGFTPDASTLQSISDERGFNLGNLDPAKTYYGRHIPLAFNDSRIVRGEPSAQFTVIPGRGMATHLNPNVDWGRLPLNGGFETQFDTSAPPDFWVMGAGSTWNTHVSLLTNGSGLQGNNYLKLLSSGTNAATIASAEFTVNEKAILPFTYWKKAVTNGLGGGAVVVEYFDYLHVSLGTISDTIDLAGSIGTWVEVQTVLFTPPAGARFARVGFVLPAGVVSECHLDDVRLGYSPSALSRVRATTATAGSYVTGDTVKYATKVYDALGEYDPTTAWTFTALKPGYYRISAAIFSATQAWALGNSLQIYIQKNTVNQAYGSRHFAPSAANWYLTSNIDTTLLLAAGDVIRCTLNHDRAAGNVTLFADASANYFTVDRLP